MIRVSFTLSDEGLSELKGVAYVEDGNLVLRIQKLFLGLMETDSRVVEIEPGTLEDLRINRGWFKDRLVIKPWHSDLFDLIPGRHGSEIVLKVNRKQRRELEDLVEAYDTLF